MAKQKVKRRVLTEGRSRKSQTAKANEKGTRRPTVSRVRNILAGNERPAAVKLGGKIARLRESAGYSQKELAKEIGMPWPQLFNIEAGRATVSPRLLGWLLLNAGIPVDLANSENPLKLAFSKPDGSNRKVSAPSSGKAPPPRWHTEAMEAFLLAALPEKPKKSRKGWIEMTYIYRGTEIRIGLRRARKTK